MTAARLAALRAHRIASRLCVDCAAGLQDDDGTRCVECAEKNRIAGRRYRATDRAKALDAANKRRLYALNPEKYREASRLSRKLAGMRRDGEV